MDNATIVYKTTPKTQNKLKKPFGILIKGLPDHTAHQIKTLINNSSSPAVIAVGDAVSTNLFAHGIKTQLSITDNKCMRMEKHTGKLPGKIATNIKNPAGTITQEAVETIKNALENPKETQIIVEGEEDLLTLIAVKYAPENAFIIYGQPNEGVVIVEATHKKKNEVEAILQEMKTVRKAK